jgi:hypothetical protein
MHSRRGVLRSLAGAGLASGLAGCLDLPSLSESPGTGTYLDWLPAPGVMDAGPYDAAQVDPPGYRQHREAVHPAARLLVRRRFLRPESFMRSLFGRSQGMVSLSPAAGGIVVRSGVSRSNPAVALAEAGYESEGTRDGFEVFGRGSGRGPPRTAPHLVAVSGNDVVHTPPDDPLPVARSELQAVVDAGQGQVERYHAADEAVEDVGTAVGQGTFAMLRGRRAGQPFGTVVAAVRKWSLGPDRTDVRWMLRFEDAADVGVVDLEAGLAGHLSGYRNTSVETSGAEVDVRGELPTGEFDLGYPGAPGEDGVPHAQFDIEWEGTTVRVVHAAGQPVAADRLTVTVEETATDVQFADEYGTVTEGDAVTVALEAGRDVAVRWAHPAGGRPVTLASKRIAS